MNKLLAGTIAAAVMGAAGALGPGTAVAEDTTFNVGGAKVPGVPWYEYTYRAGSGYYPDAKRVLVDYPGGQIQGRALADILPPGSDLVTPSVGESVAVGSKSLDAAIRTATTGKAIPVGLSEGAIVLDATQNRLATDPTAPPPDQVTFTTFGDPSGQHGFGQSLMTTIFKPGTFVPLVDYTVPKPVDSQYDSVKVVGAYDGIADFPDRTDNLVSVANALMGAAFVHTPVAFTDPSEVPPQNIMTTVNSRGATTTTYLVPSRYLPLTLPLHYLGAPDDVMAQLDAVLRPLVDAGYSRNDNPATAPSSVFPTGMDPMDALDPGDRAKVDDALAQIRNILP
jgi:hypothetical protein